ncbi:transposase family protein [Streptomyces sp. NPDC000941]
MDGTVRAAIACPDHPLSGRRHPDSGCGRPWSLAFGDRVLLVVLGYRTNLTMEQLAALFATTDSTVHRFTADLAPHLAALLGPPPADRRELWLVDGTLIPVHDQKKTKKPKNYRRSLNVQIVCRARDRRIVAVGDAWRASARLGRQVKKSVRNRDNTVRDSTRAASSSRLTLTAFVVIDVDFSEKS